MIFGNIKNEETLQINDKTRINVEDTFISPDEAAVTLIEIEPEAAAGFQDVTTNKYLDWAFDTDGTKVVTLRVTTDAAPVTFTSSVEVLTVAGDKLFSSDADLRDSEDEIMSYLRPGRNSFLDKHREAQRRILDEFDKRRIYDKDGNRLVKEDIFDVEEVKSWSKFLTLQIIFEGLRNEVGDVLDAKSITYRQLAASEASRAAIRLDYNNDSVEDINADIRSMSMVRR